MADYIYLLETRLSRDQQAALTAVRKVAREHDITVFLVGGAIRDLISGAPVRDMDVAVQTNALKLKGSLIKAGAELSAEFTAMQQLHLRFPSGVRVEVGSTLSTTYVKPGRVTVRPATILDDLRRRDFTANAMALSLNEGSYGLLMDPLNGVADIENRELRLVSNYGFLEDPVRLIRAARLMARLGWHLDERSRGRYESAKESDYIAAMQPAERAYELEELFHEEDPLRVMQRLDEEGWLAHLSTSLGAAKANVAELQRLRDVQSQLQEQGVLADASAVQFPLLTAKLSAKDAAALKESFPRKAFVREIESLEAAGKDLAAQLTGKQAALPSQAYRLIAGAAPSVVLWTAFSSKNAAVQAKFKSFYTEWPQSRQRIPYLQMQEMRITPDVARYDELLERLFFALMDGTLETPDAIKAFLEPYSPPAPPPPVSLRRPRAAKGVKKESRATKIRKRPEDDGAAERQEEEPVAARSEGSESATGEALPDAAAPLVSGTTTEKGLAPPAAKAAKDSQPRLRGGTKERALPVRARPEPARATGKTERKGSKAAPIERAKTSRPASSKVTEAKRPAAQKTAKKTGSSAQRPAPPRSSAKRAKVAAARGSVKGTPARRSPPRAKEQRGTAPAAKKHAAKSSRAPRPVAKVAKRPLKQASAARKRR